MSMIKALSALAAMFLIAACSNNDNQTASAASTSVTPGSVGDFRQNVGDRVFFDTDSSTVREDGRQTLNRQAEWLKKYTNYQITSRAIATSAARASTTWRSVSAAPTLRAST